MCIIMLVTGLQLVFGIVLGKNCIYIYIYTHIHMVRVMIRSRKVVQFLSQLDMCQVMNDKCMTMGENISLSLTTLTTPKFMQILVVLTFSFSIV